MKILSLLSSLIFVVLSGDGGHTQRIRPGRCPSAERRANCPVYFWDQCTCDQDCQRSLKCCFTGCGFTCVVPDKDVSITTKADVVFIMDSSGSIGVDDYNKEKTFVKELANIFNISPGQARASVIIYSDNPRLIFGFDDRLNNRNVSDAIESLEYLTGRTRIDKALAVAEKVFTDARPTVPRIAFILTDGKQTESYDYKPLDVAVRPLKDLGVKMYAIGIGGHVDVRELNLLTEKPEDVFTVDSFDDLLKRLRDIILHADQPDSATPVNLIADLLFLLDSSWSVSQDVFKKEKDLVVRLAEAFHVDPKYTQAGAVTYSDTASLRIPLNKHSSIGTFRADVNLLPYQGGRKNIESAFQVALNQLEAGRSVPKIAIILTKGNDLGNPDSYTMENIRRALRDRGIHVFVIAVGEDLNINTLRRMVTGPKNLIAERSFAKLSHYAPSIARFISKHIDISTPLDPSVDVLFMIDASKSVGKENYKREKEFVSALSKSFKPLPRGPRIGLVVFDNSAYTIANIGEYSTPEELDRSLVNTPYLDGARHTDRALERAGSMFAEADRGGPKVGILLLTGPRKVTPKSLTLPAAMKRILDLGGKVFTLSIGPAVDDAEARSISSPDSIIKIPDYKDLQPRVQEIGLQISRKYGKKAQLSQKNNIDVIFMMDASAEVGPTNFIAEKTFVKSLADAFDVASDDLRAGLITYSTDAVVTSRLREYQNMEAFERVVDNARYLGSARRMDKAVRAASQDFTEARANARKMAIILTAGVQSASDAAGVKNAVNDLRSTGARIYVVAIGKRVSSGVLQPFVESPRDVVAVPAFSSLSQFVHPTANLLLGLSGIPKDYEADMVFLMDSSNGTSRSDFLIQQQIIKYLANLLSVQPGKSRAAVITYGNTPALVTTLDSYGSTKEWRQLLSSAQPVGGNRRVDNALTTAGRVFSQARPHLPKTAIVIAGGPDEGSANLDTAVQTLRSQGVKIFVMSTGSGTDYRRVVEDPGHLFTASSFRRLRNSAPLLANQIIHGNPRRKEFIADVVFVIDTSSPISREDLLKQIQFVKTVATTLNLNPGKSRAGVIAYGSTTKTLSSLSNYKSNEELYRLLDSAPLLGKQRRVDVALEEAGRVLNEARPDVYRIVVLLTAGPHREDPRGRTLREASKSIRDLGAELYVVAIGNGGIRYQLQPIVSHPRNIFTASGFGGLKSLADTLGKSVVLNSDKPEDIVADFIFLVDSSSPVTPEVYAKQKSFINTLARYLNVAPGKSRAGFVVYGERPREVASFGNYGSLEQFQDMVRRSPYLVGPRRIDRALGSLPEYFSSARDDVPKIVVIVTTGPQTPSPDAQPIGDVTKPLRGEGIRVYFVGLGLYPQTWDLNPGVITNDDIFPVVNTDELMIQTRSIARRIAGQTGAPTDLVADVIFLMDSSSDVTSPDYTLEKGFVKRLSRLLNVRQNFSRAGVFTYGSVAQIVANFDDLRTPARLDTLIDNAPSVGGIRRIDRAFTSAKDMLSNARSEVAKVIILLTAGRTGRTSKRLRDVVQPLTEAGAKIFVIAIGEQPNIQSLGRVVAKPGDVRAVVSFSHLWPKAPATARFIALRAQNCQHPVDIAFIVDSSGSISRENYAKIKRFVGRLARKFDISRDGSHAAVVLYSKTANTEINFDQHSTADGFINAVEDLPHQKSVTRIDRALNVAHKDLFGPGGSARRGVQKVAFVLTDGRQTQTADAVALDKASAPLKREGVYMVAIGIGKAADKAELRLMTERDEDVLLTDSFDELLMRVEGLVHKACEAPRRPTDTEAEIVFVIDSSTGVSLEDYARQVDFVKLIARYLNVRPGKSRAALITYGSQPSTVFNFGDYNTVPQFENLVDGALYLGGKRRVDKALLQAANVLRRAKPGAPKMVILISAGRQDPSSDALALAARPLHEMGANVYAIALGEWPGQDELDKAVRRPEDVFLVKSIDTLRGRAAPIARDVAKSTAVKKKEIDADVVFLADSSQSVSQDEYEIEKVFVRSLAKNLGVSSGKARAAFITYGSIPVTASELDDYRNFDAFSRRVSLAPYAGGLRRIDKALDEAVVEFKQSDPNTRRIAIILVAGRYSPGPNGRTLRRVSDALDALGVTSYVIAIGDNADTNELRPVVDNPEDIFLAPGFKGLHESASPVARTIIKRTEKRRTDFNGDVLFLMVSSASVNPRNYSLQKALVKGLLNYLMVGPGKSRAAMITYGDDVRTVTGFTGYRSLAELEQLVDDAPAVGGEGRVDKALTEGASVMSTARPQNPKIAILMTTGKKVLSIDGKALNDSLRTLREMGVTTFVVHVGQKPVATPQFNNIFWFQSFSLLRLVTGKVGSQVMRKQGAPLDWSADIVFAVDGSSGITTSEFVREKQFVNYLASLLNIRSGHSRGALITFADLPQIVIRFNQYSTYKDFCKRVSDARYIGGQRRIDRAFQSAYDVLESARSEVPKVLILVTNGRQSRAAADLATASKPLRDQRTKICIIGIGSGINKQSLRSAVTQSDDMKSYADFEMLLQQAPAIAQHVGKTSPTCQAPVDIAFLVDSSGSISKIDYQKMKGFIAELAKNFDIPSRKSRGAVILYSTNARKEISFSDYNKWSDFQRAVIALEHQKGYTRIDKALGLAHSQLFGPGGSARRGVQRLSIVLTDGRQTQTPDAVSLESPAQKLQREGVYIMAVGIGKGADRRELRRMTESDEDVVMILSFDSLLSRIRSLSKSACQAPRRPTKTEADVLFLADSSVDVGPNNFILEKQFIKSLATTLNIKPGKSRGALISYGALSSVVFRFGGYNTRQQFDTKVNLAPYQGGARRIDHALLSATSVIRESRPDVPKIIILLTAGPQEKGSEAANLVAKRLRDVGAKVYVIAIGRAVNVNKLKPAVERPENVIPVDSFNDLKPVGPSIGREVAKGSESTVVKPRPTEKPRTQLDADILFVMDSSVNVNPADYKREKEFVKAFARSLNVRPGKSRTAVITYGDEPMIINAFNGYRTVDEMNREIDRAPAIGGSRRLDKAAEVAATVLSAARERVPRIVVLITAGREASGNPLDIAVQPLRDVGANIYVLAIGTDHNKPEMLKMVNNPEDLFVIKSFVDLPEISTVKANDIAQRSVVKKARDYSADIVFAMDSSSGVNPNNYREEKDFVKSAARYMNAFPGKSRAAAVTYGESGLRVAEFDDSRSTLDFERLIENAPIVGGRRRIDKGLDSASFLMTEARGDVPKVVILLATGLQDRTANKTALGRAVRLLRDLDTKLYVVAIGSDPRLRDSFSQVVRRENMWSPDSYDRLLSAVQPATSAVVTSSGVVPSFEADVIFLMDSSSQVTRSSYLREKEFVKFVSRLLNIQPGRSRGAVVSYGDRAQSVTSFDNYRSISEYETQIDGASYVGGERRTDLALREAEGLVRQARLHFPKIVILMTAGRPSDRASSLAVPLRQIRQSGAQVFVVSVGRPVDISPELVNHINVPNFQDLRAKGPQFAKNISSVPALCTAPSDIAFIIESSSIVGRQDFSKIKQFISWIAENFHISPSHSRLAVILFSDNARTVINFNDYGRYDRFKTAVDRLPRGAGATRIDRALEAASTDLFGTGGSARRGVHRVAIVITAGKQTPDRDATPLEQAARLLWREGVHVIGIGVGSAVDKMNLRSMTEREEDVVMATSFSELQNRVGSVTKKACVGPTRSLDTKAEIVFVVDSSAVVPRADFRKLKAFVKRMAHALNVSPSKSRAGCIAYGYTPITVFQLGHYASSREFDSKVDRAPYVGGATRTDKALEAAADILERGRPGFPKVAIFVTAGRQTRAIDMKTLRAASEPLRRTGAVTFVVAIGRAPDKQELRPVVGRGDDIYEVSSYDDLKTKARPIAREISSGIKGRITSTPSPTPTPTPTPTEIPTLAPTNFEGDVLFLVDSSYPIGQRDYNKEKDFIKSLAYALNVSPERSRGAVITYGYAPLEVVRYNGYRNTATFKQLVERAPSMGGPRRLDRALELASNIAENARKDKPATVVLLTAGRQARVPGAKPLGSAADPLKQLGVNIFVVGIGQAPDRRELRPIVNRRDEDVLSVASFDHLQQRANYVAQHVARWSKLRKRITPIPSPTPTSTEIPTPAPTNFEGDVLFLVDSSYPISQSDYSKEKDFIKYLTDALNISPGRSRGAVITYGYAPLEVVRYNGYRNTATFKQLVERAPSMGGPRRLDRALELASNIVKYVRKDKPASVVLLTAGRQARAPDAKPLGSVADPLKQLGVNIFVVATGREPDRREISQVVNRDGDIFSVASFNDLQSRANRVAQHVARRSKLPDIVVSPDFKADVVFLVDSSSFVTRQGFNAEKAFVKSFARIFNLSPTKSRVALVSYGSSPERVFNFNDYRTARDFEQLMDRARYLGSPSRRADKAVEEAARILRSSRADVPRLVVLLSGGQDSAGARPLTEAIKPLKDLGAKLFVIRVRNWSDRNALINAVDRERDAVFLPSYRDLDFQVRPFARHVAARADDPTPLDTVVDVMFLLDASGRVQRQTFDKEKAIIKLMAAFLNVAPRKSRAGFMTYGDSTLPHVSLRRETTLDDFSRILDASSIVGGQRRMDLALKSARQAFDNPRENVTQVIVLLTTGRPGSGSGDLQQPSQYLKRKGVKIFVVATDSEPKDEILRTAVEKPEDIFRLLQDDKLKRDIREVSKKIVKRLETEEPVLPHFNADVVFLMDASLNKDDYLSEKYFVMALARRLGSSPSNVRPSLVIYGNRAKLVSRLSGFRWLADFDRAVYDSPRLVGPRRMDLALEAGSRALQEARHNVKMIAVLLTAGTQDPSVPSLRQGIQALQQMGAKTFVITLGQRANIREVRPVVESADDIVLIPSFNNIQAQADPTAKRIISRSHKDIVPPLDIDADVVLLIDSSADVTQENFNREKDFAKKISRSLNVSPGKSRAAVISYGGQPRIVTNLEGRYRPEDFDRLVDNALAVGGLRRMDRALQEASGVLKKARADKPKMVILLTAGRASSGSRSLHKVAAPLNDMGAAIFVVAIGKRPDIRDLSLAVDKPEDVIPVHSFESLPSQARQIATKITKQTMSPEPPTVASDIVFLVDSSSVIGQRNFLLEKNFLKSLGSSLKVAFDGVRGAVVSFAARPVVSLDLNDATTPKQFAHSVDRVPYQGGPRNYTRALETAVRLFRRAKKLAVKTVVLLTGGTIRPNLKSEQMNKVVEELQRNDVKVYVVYVGFAFAEDAQAFRPIVDKPADIFALPSFQTLPSEGKNVGGKVKLDMYHPMNVSAEVVFVVDSSSTVSRDDYKKEKDFVKSFARIFNVRPGKSRAGFITYGRNPRIEAKFGDSRTTSEFQRIVQDGLYMGGEGRMDRALQTAASLLSRARSGSPKVVLLFTAGRNSQGAVPDKVVQEVQERGGKVFVVSIGRDPAQQKDLVDLVERPDHVMKMGGFNSLQPHVVPMARFIATQLATPKMGETDVIFLADSSSDVDRRVFQHQQSFAKHFASLFGLSPKSTRAAFISYGNMQLLVGGFHNSQVNFDIAVSETGYVGGTRKLNSALDAALRLFKETPPTSGKVLILITAGTIRESAATLAAYGQRLRDTGVSSFVVSVGPRPSTNTLKSLIVKPEDLFPVPSSKRLLPNQPDGFPYYIILQQIEPAKPLDATFDIVFMVDASSDVTRPQFLLEKDFVTSISKRLDFAKSRAAFIVYGSTAMTAAKLDTANSPTQFASYVNRAPFVGGERRMDRALDKASTLLTGSRPRVSKIAFIITAGRQDNGIEALYNAAQVVRRQGTHTFVVAITDRVEDRELKTIADKSSDIIRVPTFQRLKEHVNPVLKRLIEDYGSSVPQGPTYDVIFLIDTSEGVTPTTIAAQKDFVKAFSRQFNVPPRKARLAFVTYGSYPNLEMRFNGFKSQREFEDAVNKGTIVGGDRRLDRALHMANRALSESKPSPYRIAVLLTAGRQSSEVGDAPVWAAAQALRATGIKTYVVAIGNNINVGGIRPIVERDRDLFLVPSDSGLSRVTGGAVNEVAASSGPLKPSDLKADVVFLVDSSAKVSRGNYLRQQRFVKTMARQFQIGTSRTHGAVVSYGWRAVRSRGLRDYETLRDFDRKVDSVGFVGGARRLDNALNTANSMFNNGRNDAMKILILFIAGKQDPASRSLAEATKPLRQTGVLTYVIAIGKDADGKEVGPLVERPENVIAVSSFAGLQSLVGKALMQILDGAMSRHRFQADIVFLIDGSGEVDSTTFRQQERLVTSLARYFNVGRGLSRAGLIIYGSSPSTALKLEDSQTLSRFDSAVRRAGPVSGPRRIDLALKAAARELLSGRKGIPRIAVLLTAGRQAEVAGMLPLSVARQYLEDVNARTIVIGIGRASDVREMNVIASSSKDVFTIPNIQDVLLNVPIIIQQSKKPVKQEPSRQRSTKPIDVMFLMDSSNDMSSNLFELQKRMIRSLARQFVVSPSRARLAVITYGNIADLVIPFNRYRNILDFIEGLQSVPFAARGTRRLDRALQKADTLMADTRRGAQKVVFLITAGPHTAELGSTPLPAAARPLHEKSAQLFVISLGPYRNMQELRDITRSDGRIYIVPASKGALPPVNVINLQIATDKGEMITLKQKTDILFLVDSSDSVTNQDFEKSKFFIKSFSRFFQVASDKTNFAVISFGNSPDLSIRFDEHVTTRGFINAVRRVPYIGGTKRLDNALVLGARILSNGRPSAKKIALIISDGQQRLLPGMEPLDLAAQPLHGLGAKVYVIGTGANPDIYQLNQIIHRPGDLFITRSYEDIVWQIPLILRYILAGRRKQTTGFVADVMFLVDTSSFLSNEEFATQLDVVKGMSRRFRVSPVGTRGGVITYDDDARLIIDFPSYNTSAQYYSMLNNLDKRGGGRRLDKAIELAGNTFAKIRRNAAKLMIILAKDRQVTDDNDKALSSVIRPLNNLGVVTSVVAIGPNVDVRELSSFVQKPESIVFVNSYAALLQDLDRIWKQIVGATVVRCNATLDVGILMDSSGSLGLAHYAKERQFIKSIIRELLTSSPRSRVGIVPFSDYAAVAVSFTDFETMSNSELDATIEGLPYEQGRTRIDRALGVANKELFTNKRPGVSQVLILVTDGAQSTDPGYIPVKQAILPFREKNIKTLAVGVGRSIDFNELTLITADVNRVFIVGAFNELEGIVRGLVSSSCSI